MRKRVKKNNSKPRLFIVGSCISVIFLSLIIRIGYITLVKGDEYAYMAESEWNSEISVSAKRGNILDRNGAPLVSSSNVYRVDFDIKAINNYLENNDMTVEDVANKLSGILKVDYNEVLETLKTDNLYPNLIKGIEKDVADKVSDLNIYGVIISSDIRRVYPNGNFLAHTLGSINSDGKGLTGVELQYDSYLSGIQGMKIGGVDGKLNTLPFTPHKITPAVDGKDVTLTIDETLQYISENVAEKGLIENKAKRVSILIMDPNNGEVLSMVNKGDFNPNTPYEGAAAFDGETDNDKLQSMWRNSLISDTFEPGSTFKTITMIAAMEEGLVSENEIFHCTGGIHFGDTYVKCWNTAGHGNQTLPEILKNSCNVGFMVLGERLGKEKLNEYIRKLGFGRITGIDLPGEADGIIKANEDILPIDLATIAFGQTNTVTAIQLMTAFNAIANGGDLIQPHVVKEISHLNENSTRVIDETIEGTIKKNILSKDKTAILRGYLERTATQDGPPGSFVQGYNVGGKTGTAQKVDYVNGGYSADKYIASMVALAPVDNPKITVFLAVDEPSTGVYYGGQVAMPLMKELFAEIFKYLDSPLAQARYSIAKDIIIPEIRGKTVEEAEAILKANNLNFDLVGKGENITSVEPSPGTTVKDGERIKIHADRISKLEKDIVMPDLRGSSLEFTKGILDNLGITYEYVGDGDVAIQSIPSGTVISKGTKVSLTLKAKSEY